MTQPLPFGYVNGVIRPIEQARISPLDRGFIFGDAVYEVVPVFDGRPFLLERHLERLQRSLAAISIRASTAMATWHEILVPLIEQNGGGDQSIYIQISRGVAPRDHVIPADAEPTVVVFCSPLKPSALKAARAITLEDNRWGRCDIKSTALLANVLLKTQAHAAGADEAVLIRAGQVTEGAASNVFIYRNDTVVTPPKSNVILPGITRDFLLEVLRGSAYPVAEREILASELHEATEIWMTSSSRELLPVTELDGSPIGDGAVGPVVTAVYELYQQAKRSYLSSHQPYT